MVKTHYYGDDCFPKHENPHEHEWQPAGVIEKIGLSVTVWGMCKCGEIRPFQWDY